MLCHIHGGNPTLLLLQFHEPKVPQADNLTAMPPIPIYAHSPINAAKADDAPPKAAAGQGGAASEKTPIITAAPDLNQARGYQPIQAVTGAGPPGPTSASKPSAFTPAQPTATATRTVDSNNNQGPPAPQPGAVPTPYGASATATSTLPPPPKAGEKYQPPQQTQSPTASMPYPAQMAVPPPTVPHGQRGTASAVAPGYAPQAVNLTGGAGGAAAEGSNLSHPPGYHQNVNAAELNSHQRAAHQANVSGPGLVLGVGGVGMGGGGSGPAGEEGVWDSAVKFVQAAGEKLSAAESEVWRRISKD